MATLKRKLGLNYNEIGLKKNRPLPSWLTCTLKNRVIYLKGIPQNLDEGKLMIRIMSTDDCVLL
jgi:hypothetical protein